MTPKLTNLIVITVFLFYSSCTLAATDADQNTCLELSPLMTNSVAEMINPARSLTKAELTALEKANLELLESVEYSTGAIIVDVDNDKINDLLVWSIQGSGRFTYAEVYTLAGGRLQGNQKLTLKYRLDLGVLEDPRLVRFKGSNYFVYSESGDSDDLRVTQIRKARGTHYEMKHVCSMQITLKADTTCKHPACKSLKGTIENKNTNASFINIEWPHKYLPPAGAEVFYSSDWSTGDFDNSGQKSVISRFGRKGYIYQNIYWQLLGQDIDEAEVVGQPDIDEAENMERVVLPDQHHDRLRKSLQQQSVILSKVLKKNVELPKIGEFFLFNANKAHTYWAWDFDEQPYGRELHIVYSNRKKSDYIGLVRVSRDQQLAPCKKECITVLNK